MGENSGSSSMKDLDVLNTLPTLVQSLTAETYGACLEDRDGSSSQIAAESAEESRTSMCGRENDADLRLGRSQGDALGSGRGLGAQPMKPLDLAGGINDAYLRLGRSQGDVLESEQGLGAQPMKPLDPEEFRALGHQTVDLIADYLQNVGSFPVVPDVMPGFLKHLLHKSAPEEPMSWDEVMFDLKSKILPGVTHWRSPNFFAYFPSSGSTASMLGEMICTAVNTIGFNWLASPSTTELEVIALDWLGQLLGLPDAFLSAGGKGGGIIQGTASEALLVAMLAARKRSVDMLTSDGKMTNAEAMSKLVAYASDQAHSSMQKAVMLAGIETSNFRSLPTDDSTQLALSPTTLSDAIDDDLKNGKVPFFLCATVGTTSSTAIDPVRELGRIAKEHGIWLHVDAAYAGSACICPEYRHFLNGVELADSFNTNPHKWLLTNFDCSTLWVQDKNLLLDAFSLTPEYLRYKKPGYEQAVDYKDWSIPLGRRFRALKLWMVMSLYGASGLRTHVRKHIGYAGKLKEIIESNLHFEILAPQTFGLVCFRLKPLENDEDNGTTLNALLLERVNGTRRLFFTHTVLGGVYTLRLVVGGVLTEWQHVEAAWSLIAQVADTLLLERRVERCHSTIESEIIA